MGLNFGSVNYLSTIPPEGYRCNTCGRHGCKLWREYQTFLNHQTLACCDCAAKEQKKDVTGITDDGMVPDPKYGASLSSDQIGWRIPAVPTEEGDTYWGYSSVPMAGVGWWKRLPTRVEAP